MRGRRTLRRLKRQTQEFAYRSLRIAELEEQQERAELEAAMGFAGQWDEHRRFQMEFLRGNGLKPDMQFCEIGCGPLTLGIPLIDYLNVGHYTGIDVRQNVMSIAYKQVAKHDLVGKNPRLLVSNSFGDLELKDELFDAYWSFSLLFHLNDDLVNDLFAIVSKRLKKNGHYWANINQEVEESTWLEFPFVRRDPNFYADLAGKHGLEMHHLGSIKDNGFQLDTLEAHNILLKFHHSVT